MNSLITCPGCKHKLTLPETYVGQLVKCPKCERDFEAQKEATLALDLDSPASREDAKPAVEPAPPTSLPPPLPEPLHSAYAPRVSPPLRTAPLTETPSIFCIECGTKFAKSEEWCPGCGLTVRAMLEERMSERRRPRPRMLPPMSSMLAVVGAILIPTAIVCFLSGPIVYNSVPRHSRWLGEVVILIGCVGGGLALLASLVCSMIWLYQAWRLVSRGDEDFSPGLKIGLLFVPVFNLYWMFVVILGLSTAIQEELRYLAPARSHNAGWVPGLIACILMLIPYFQPVAICMYIAWMLIANNALQRIIRYHERLREEDAAERSANGNAEA